MSGLQKQCGLWLLAVSIFFWGAGTVGTAMAQPDSSVTDVLSAAQEAMNAGNYQKAADLTMPVLSGNAPEPETDRANRAEAWRLYGLALYHLERFGAARTAFFECLKLDTTIRLDPALVPPEVVAFFEDVRIRNADELRKYDRRARKRRSFALNLVPPLGQFQNGQPTKGIIIAGVAGVALAANIGSFVVLRRWCSADTGLCELADGTSREGEAKVLSAVNITSGILFLGTLAYGVVDGVTHYRRQSRAFKVGWMPLDGGGGVVASGQF